MKKSTTLCVHHSSYRPYCCTTDFTEARPRTTPSEQRFELPTLLGPQSREHFHVTTGITSIDISYGLRCRPKPVRRPKPQQPLRGSCCLFARVKPQSLV